jgi:phospholipid/cholesterol/gamma-HCH transport system substrate-binding protein
MKHNPKNGSPFLIGIFVLSAIVLSVSVIIWLGANQFLKERVFYVTYIDGSVEGIEKGSAVKYQGVPCGKIDDIKVAPDGRLVEIIMQIDDKIKINENLRVRTALAGLAGGKFLELHYPENPEMALLHPPLNFRKPYPVINSAPSSLAEISIAAQKVMNNLLVKDWIIY